MSLYCCRHCFSNDPTISWKIHQSSDREGVCDYCSSPAEPLLKPAVLQSYFEPFLDIYEPSAGKGRILSELLRKDWGIFEGMRPEASQRLMADVFSDPDLLSRTFTLKAALSAEPLEQWSSFRESIKYSNRFFVNKLDLMVEALPLLETQEIPERLFRARIQSSDTPYNHTEMGAPPKEICGNGRANPAGIPYLYLASHDQVAISEVRPSPGDMVTVATFARPQSQLVLIDLREPKIRISPFSGEPPLEKLRKLLSLLENLGRELSAPVVPRMAQLEYLPSQYLCEQIKNIGFDGVIYNSSLSPGGWNYAFFNPSEFQAVECRTVLISGITVESTPYPITEALQS